MTSDPIISYAYYCLSSAWVGFSFLFLKTAESESESWTDSDTEYITVTDSDDDSFEEALQHDERLQPRSPTCKKARSTPGRTSSDLLWVATTTVPTGGVEVRGHGNFPSADNCGSADPSKRDAVGEHGEHASGDEDCDSHHRV